MPTVRHQLNTAAAAGAGPVMVTIRRVPDSFAATGQSETAYPTTVTAGPATGPDPDWPAGYFEVSLPGEASYATPGYYVISYPENGRTVSHPIRVPDAGGPYWLAALVTEVTPTPAILPAALSGLRDTQPLAAAAVGQVPVWDGTAWVPSSGAGGGGVSDHGLLTGLADDDHPQYVTQAEVDGMLAGKAAVAHTHPISDVTGLQAALDALPRLTATTQPGHHTLTLADAGTAVHFTGAAAANCTVPPNSAVAFPVGTVVELLQAGAGQVTVLEGAGVTVRAAAAKTTRAQWSVLRLRKIGADEWLLSGDMT